MEKRVFGIILTVLGIVGIILAAINFMQGGASMKNVKEITVYGIIGLIFFFAGIGLIRTTRDKAT
jgi:uncharacterized membrane protein